MKIVPRHILITGAGSGVGRGLAVYFGERGHRLTLTDLNEAGLQETMGLLGADVTRAKMRVLDVSSASQIADLFNTLAGDPVEVLINNAGLQHVSALEEFPEAKWDLLLDVMLKGPFLMTRAALPGMRKINFGRIINIGSIHSLVASPFKSAYIAAKHGLVGLAKTVALETGAADITINTLCPAYVRTPLVDAQIKSQAKTNNISEVDVVAKIMLEPMPKKAFITVEEIAGLAEFLFSDAARNITAQTIAIDGGWTAR